MHKLAAALALALPLLAFAQDAGAPPNPVQKEMQLLHAVMATSLDAIEKGVLAPIPGAVEQVKAAREQTEQAIASGAWVPPRPGATLKAFTREDEAFHRELEKLAALAQKNDLAAVSRQYGTVLNACTGCHQRFKYVAPPAAKSK